MTVCVCVCVCDCVQVEGKHGLAHLRSKMSKNGIRVMYNGSLAASGATVVGHFPWFFTFNVLNEKVRSTPASLSLSLPVLPALVLTDTRLCVQQFSDAGAKCGVSYDINWYPPS